MRILGVVLIVLGGLALAFHRISYPTRRDLVSVGPLHGEVETRKIIPLPPLFGALTVAGGIVLVIAARGKS